jgi:hypothetical protein
VLYPAITVDNGLPTWLAYWVENDDGTTQPLQGEAVMVVCSLPPSSS